MTPGLTDEAEEWADRLQTRVNEREAFAEAAEGFTATLRFLVLPDDDYDGDPIALTLLVEDGVCVAAVGNDPDASYDVSLSGPYGAWRDLLEDETDVAAAVTGGPFDFEGSTTTLLRHRDAVEELVRAARNVETEFAE